MNKNYLVFYTLCFTCISNFYLAAMQKPTGHNQTDHTKNSILKTTEQQKKLIEEPKQNPNNIRFDN